MRILLIRPLLFCTAAAAAAAVPALAQDTAPPPPFSITGSAAIASQYRFRGISQSNNRPVVQGAFTVSHSSGFYLSAWGSSASAGNSTVDIGGSEIDVFGGYSHALGASGFSFDGGLYGYLYPGAPAGDYYEVYGSLSKTYGPATAKIGINFAPDQGVFDHLPGTNANTYVYGELGFGVPGTPISIHSHLGHTAGGFDYTGQYLDYTVGAAYKWKLLSFDLSVVGTNVSRTDAARSPLPDQTGALSPYQTYRAAKTVLVGSVTASF